MYFLHVWCAGKVQWDPHTQHLVLATFIHPRKLVSTGKDPLSFPRRNTLTDEGQQHLKGLPFSTCIFPFWNVPFTCKPIPLLQTLLCVTAPVQDTRKLQHG